MSFPDEPRGRLARWLFWPRHRHGDPSDADLERVRPPWPGLVAFEQGRLALARGDWRAESMLEDAAKEPLVRLLASVLGVVATQQRARPVAAGSYGLALDSGLELALDQQLRELEESVPPAWFAEVLAHAVPSPGRPVRAGLGHLWTPGDWSLVGTEAPECGPAVPDAVLLREFEAAQELDDVDLLFCLPDRGSAWVKTRGQEALPVLPQAVRVLVAATTGSDPVHTALGPGAPRATWDKLVSRTKRVFQKAAVPLRFERGVPIVAGTTLALVYEASRSPAVRLRRGDGPLPFLAEQDR